MSLGGQSVVRPSGLLPQSQGGLVFPRDRLAGGYVRLATRLFQGATVADLGRAAGAKSIEFPSGAEDWTLVNGTANFLAADPAGCFIDASGFKFGSGSSACSDDWGDGNTLGPCLYKLVSEIVPAELWSGTTIGLVGMYAFLDFVWIVDASAANAANELIVCGIGVTSAFGNGGAGRVGAGAAGAASAGSAFERGSYSANLVATSTFSFPGSALPTAIRVRVSPEGQEFAFGVASGLTPPSAWYSREALHGIAADGNPNTTTSHFGTSMVAAIGLVDSNGGGAMVGNVKALYINGQRHLPGQSLAVAA